MRLGFVRVLFRQILAMDVHCVSMKAARDTLGLSAKARGYPRELPMSLAYAKKVHTTQTSALV